MKYRLLKEAALQKLMDEDDDDWEKNRLTEDEAEYASKMCRLIELMRGRSFADAEPDPGKRADKMAAESHDRKNAKEMLFQLSNKVMELYGEERGKIIIDTAKKWVGMNGPDSHYPNNFGDLAIQAQHAPW